jgi:hypothetical protein
MSYLEEPTPRRENERMGHRVPHPGITTGKGKENMGYGEPSKPPKEKLFPRIVYPDLPGPVYSDSKGHEPDPRPPQDKRPTPYYKGQPYEERTTQGIPNIFQPLVDKQKWERPVDWPEPPAFEWPEPSKEEYPKPDRRGKSKWFSWCCRSKEND